MPANSLYALTLTLTLNLTVTAALGCSRGNAAVEGDGAVPDAAADATDDRAAGGGDAGVNDGAPETGGGGGQGGGNRFATVEATLVAQVAAAGLADIGLAIWDAQDHKVYEHMVGSFTADTRVSVASASKLVAGLV